MTLHAIFSNSKLCCSVNHQNVHVNTGELWYDAESADQQKMPPWYILYQMEWIRLLKNVSVM